jgi:hypothetical protein
MTTCLVCAKMRKRKRKAAAAAGQCQRCHKRPKMVRDDGTLSYGCKRCVEKHRAANQKYYARVGHPEKYPPSPDDWCIHCQAHGFHRFDCQVRRAV